ncbi:hypothetical protein [Mycobacterium sp. 1274761.0]|uniref:hypothetical protein n=1 Tax=Mycobacterium sp. 1274761.0 TaxID=1834077 RepID=UPI0007FF3022|nr:hypothetical protein [Mycobacterium sp. 1274761.0]OBK78662.1 hypothetical protein A5651_01660 [Mycobacterium sp. 1274761.0]
MTVSFSDRAFDTREPNQPATVSVLLRELGMAHACVEKQRVALGTWLMIHEAQRPLRISLLKNGYGLLLKQVDAKRAKAGALA